MPSSQQSAKMFDFDDAELNISDPEKNPGGDDSGIAMSVPRPVLAENQEKTNGSTGSCKSTDTVLSASVSSVKKQWSPNAKRPKRRVQTISGPRFEDVYNLKDDMLGCGAYASVRTCASTVTGKEYAVKIIEKRPGCSGGRTRVIKEIESFHMCANHPNIVQLIEYFEEDSKFYLVFEKMRGGPLLNHIQRQICFTEFEACLVVKDIAHALKFLHDKGIAHRDVKPENILCTYPDRAHPVKLCDLDLASKMNQFPTSVTTPELQSPVGSAEFMAPEVVDAFVGEALTYDKRCDMWSLGVILYIMLCGYPPFYGDCWRPNCGWDQGLPCSDCQEALFGRIQKGSYYFPDEEWQHISDNAKDLINHLLVRDATLRYTADNVLKHPWMQEDLPKTPLLTPEILQRKDSVRDMQQLNENFNAFTRIMTIQRQSRGSIGGPDRVIANGAGNGGINPLNIIVERANNGAKARAAPLPRINRGSSRAPSGLVTARDSCGGSASHAAQRKMSRGDHSDDGAVPVRV